MSRDEQCGSGGENHVSAHAHIRRVHPAVRSSSAGSRARATPDAYSPDQGSAGGWGWSRRSLAGSFEFVFCVSCPNVRTDETLAHLAVSIPPTAPRQSGTLYAPCESTSCQPRIGHHYWDRSSRTRTLVTCLRSIPRKCGISRHRSSETADATISLYGCAKPRPHACLEILEGRGKSLLVQPSQ